MSIEKYVVEVETSTGQIVGQPVPFTGQLGTTTIVQDNSAAIYMNYGIGAGVLVLVLFAVWLTVFTVKNQTVKIVERFGKFKKVVKAGLNFKIPFIDRVAGTLDLRIQQMGLQVETKTLDNVFVYITVMVQYYIDPEKTDTAFYKLDEVVNQIKSYVFDKVRSEVPKLKLDAVFTDKETIAKSVKSELAETFGDFGFKILETLVTDISPDEEVKKAMNEIQVQTRTREANEQKGEAEKILVVKKAEAEAESKKLQGLGIANQRIEIATGLEKSTAILKKAGVSPAEVMPTIMLTQYFDTIKDVGNNNNTKVIFMPSTPAGVTSMAEEIRNAMVIGNEAKV